MHTSGALQKTTSGGGRESLGRDATGTGEVSREVVAAEGRASDPLCALSVRCTSPLLV